MLHFGGYMQKVRSCPRGCSEAVDAPKGGSTTGWPHSTVQMLGGGSLGVLWAEEDRPPWLGDSGAQNGLGALCCRSWGSGLTTGTGMGSGGCVWSSAASISLRTSCSPGVSNTGGAGRQSWGRGRAEAGGGFPSLRPTDGFCSQRRRGGRSKRSGRRRRRSSASGGSP